MMPYGSSNRPDRASKDCGSACLAILLGILIGGALVVAAIVLWPA